MNLSLALRRAGIVLPQRFESDGDEGVKPPLASLTLAELEMDSLAFQELSIQIFLEYGVDVTPSEIESCTSLGELEGAIRNSGGGSVRHSAEKIELQRFARYSQVGLLAPGELGRYALNRHALKLVITGARALFYRISGKGFDRAKWLALKRDLRETIWLQEKLRSFQPGDREWQRTEISPSIQLYERPKSRVSQGGYTLVGFPGSTGRLMLPVSLLLAALPRKVNKLVFSVIPLGRGDQAGSAASANELGQSLEHLRIFLEERSSPVSVSQKTVVLGTSAGTMPAFIFSTLYSNPSTCLLVGPQSPLEPPWTNHALFGSALDYRKIMTTPNAKDWTRLRIIYGAESAKDLKRRPDWDALSHDGVRGFEGVGHGVLYPLFEQGRLQEVFREMFGIAED